MRRPLINVMLGLLLLPLVLANPSGTNVVISEIMYDPNGTETGTEWVELYNPTSSAISIAGWILYEVNGPLSGHVIASGSVIPARGHFLLRDQGSTFPAGLPTPNQNVSFGLSNSEDGLRLVDLSFTVIDKVGWESINDTDYYEGAPHTPNIAEGKSLERKLGGTCGNAMDTDNNAVDFFIQDIPTPQNSQNATVTPCNVTLDTTPPGTISNLAATNITNQSITWTWINPTDADFNSTILFLNGVNQGTFAKPINSRQFLGLAANTNYTLTVQTKDHSSNINITTVSSKAQTLANPAPVIPKVTIVGPANNSIVTSSSFMVNFSTENWVLGGKGSNHIHFHIDGVPGLTLSNHLMFYNGADAVVEFETNPGPTAFATWIDQDTIRFNNVPDGIHTIRAHLANAAHQTLSGNSEADKFIKVTVNTAACSQNADCSDGLFCNGIETCVSGSCQAGNPVACNDGTFCNGQEVCNENNDSCQSGAAPAIDDGIACTQDSCNENLNQVTHAPNNALCTDGLFCNGQEVCSALNGCGPGISVVCDNGFFCDGNETCNENTDGCELGIAPGIDDNIACTTDSCNETSNTIVHAPQNNLCQDGQYCNGQEVCNAATGCQAGPSISCNANNIPGINSCGNNPDNNPKTADFRAGFISSCNEAIDSCTTGNSTITHACSLACGAGCTQNSDCALNQICDLSSCSCISDGILRPDVAIILPANNSITGSTDVLVSFSTKDWNVSAKNANHIYFTLTNVSGLNANDQLHFYNAPNNALELGNAPTNYASWLSNNSFILHNIGNGIHTLSAQLVFGNNTIPADSNAKETITFTTLLPFCGDNVKNQLSELCDGNDLSGKSCVDYGFSNPLGLACAASCDGFVSTNCIATCGDGNKEPSEQCDDNNLANGDGCSSLCRIEYTDDLQIDYLRGKITFDGAAANNNTGFIVEVTAGQNAGISYSGFVDDSHVVAKGAGNFDTADQLMFSTGDLFTITATGCNANYSGSFFHGGNIGIYLNCTIAPEIGQIYHSPSQPHDLEDTIIYANVSDNSIDTVKLNYSINGSTLLQTMNPAGGLYQLNLGTLPLGTHVIYFIEALDNYGNKTRSASHSFIVITHDYDKDGSNSSLDCNDSDATIYPGAPEAVDVIDQNCINDAPQFSGTLLNQSWDEDFALNNTFDLDDYFSDVDDNGLLNFSYTDVSPITVTIGLNNQVSFSQPANWHGTKEIVFSASDGSLAVSGNVIKLDVVSVDDAPIFLYNVTNVSVKETKLLDLNASGQLMAIDADNDPISYLYSCLPANCTLDSTGKWQTDLGDKGSYVANVSALAGLQSVSQLINITVIKKFEGDVNNDNVVNILDLVVVRRAFGLTPQSPGWNPDIDVNHDSVINILDLIFVRIHFT